MIEIQLNIPTNEKKNKIKNIAFYIVSIKPTNNRDSIDFTVIAFNSKSVYIFVSLPYVEIETNRFAIFCLTYITVHTSTIPKAAFWNKQKKNE